MARDRHGLAWIRKEQELAHQAALNRGAKEISDLPGDGIGSYAEDDPETHASFQTREPSQEE